MYCVRLAELSKYIEDIHELYMWSWGLSHFFLPPIERRARGTLTCLRGSNSVTIGRIILRSNFLVARAWNLKWCV